MNSSRLHILAVLTIAASIVPAKGPALAQCPAGVCIQISGISHARDGSELVSETDRVIVSRAGTLTPASKSSDIPANSIVYFHPDFSDVWLRLNVTGQIDAEVVLGPTGPYRFSTDGRQVVIEILGGPSDAEIVRKTRGVLGLSERPPVRGSTTSAGGENAFTRTLSSIVSFLDTEAVYSDTAGGMYVTDGCISLRTVQLKASDTAQIAFPFQDTVAFAPSLPEMGASFQSIVAPSKESACSEQPIDSVTVDSTGYLPPIAVMNLTLAYDPTTGRFTTAGATHLTAAGLQSVSSTLSQGVWSHTPIWIPLAVIGGVALIGGGICVAAGCLDGQSTGAVVVKPPSLPTSMPFR